MTISQKYSGIVITGMQLGRKLGFPTANISVEKPLDIPFGVYAVNIVIGDDKYNGISNYGVKPSFSDSRILIETYIFDFSENIYNKQIEIEFIEYIRSEQKFNLIDELQNQINIDIETAKKIIIVR